MEGVGFADSLFTIVDRLAIFFTLGMEKCADLCYSNHSVRFHGYGSVGKFLIMSCSR